MVNVWNSRVSIYFILLSFCLDFFASSFFVVAIYINYFVRYKIAKRIPMRILLNLYVYLFLKLSAKSARLKSGLVYKSSINRLRLVRLYLCQRVE